VQLVSGSAVRCVAVHNRVDTLQLCGEAPSRLVARIDVVAEEADSGFRCVLWSPRDQPRLRYRLHVPRVLSFVNTEGEPLARHLLLALVKRMVGKGENAEPFQLFRVFKL